MSTLSREGWKRFVPIIVVAAWSVGGWASGNIDDADPLVGTSGHGHAYPGATVPFGMVQLSPDTRTDSWDGSSGYHYSDSRIIGFSHTHLSGTGIGAMGDVMVMPTVGDFSFRPGAVSSAFSHKREVAKPGYYRVALLDSGVTAELTASARAGYHHYTFPASSKSHIVLDLRHGISNDVRETFLRQTGEGRFEGYRISGGWGGTRIVYFALEVSKKPNAVSIERDGLLLPSRTREAKGRIAASLDFDTKAGEAIDVRVGISSTGFEGAAKNLAREIPVWSFAKARAAATQQWEQALGTINIEEKSKKARRTFYSNLYLCFLAPTLFNDADGSYIGMDRKVHTAPGFQNYSTFSLWDTFRALHPLLTLTQPKRIDDMVNSLLTEYDQGGHGTLPVWPLAENETWTMIGYHSVPVIVDAYLKGFRGFDAEKAYQALRATAMHNRDGLDTYKKLGYVASRPGMQATSKTLEYAYDDWCIAKMAEMLGHREDAALFYQRAANYRNHFDRRTRLMRGRRANGEWRTPFDQLGHVGDEYTEADAWQYTFFAPQDVPGLATLYGGEAGLVRRLDDMFSMTSEIHTGIPDITGLIGQFAQGNEPCHHIPYLYAMVGAPAKTQHWVREIAKRFYDDTPSGQTGNVDCGQMSAWYIFSALGFYPVNPANGIYILGSPIVDRAVLNGPNGKKFTVIASGNGPRNVYVQSAMLNGKPLDRPWITHDEIRAGGVLQFAMGPRPSLKWGMAMSTRPRATMPKNFAYTPLPAASSNKPVVLSIPIRVVSGDEEQIGEFIGDPNIMEGSTNRSDSAIDTNVPMAGPAGIYQSERYGKDFSHRFAVPAGTYKVRLHFAELFDSEIGFRRFHVSINGVRFLQNFDIRAEAGAMNRAVVREIVGIHPNAKGQIVIRIQAVQDSPDQNAKISAIEILPQEN